MDPHPPNADYRPVVLIPGIAGKSVRMRTIVALREKRIVPYFYMAPTMMWLLFFIIYPLIFALVMAFKRFKLKRGLTIWDMPWVGFDNFINAFTDQYFLLSLKTTFIILFTAVSIEFVIGMIVAYLLNKEKVRYDPLWMILILSPLMLPLIASGNLWRMLFDIRWGAVNAVIMFFGINPIDFLGNADWSLMTVIIVDIWQWTPFVIIILLAGMRSVPQEPVEAALADGATNWQIFRHITLPLMKGQILIVLLIRGMDVFKTFDIVYALTFGGPGQSTTVATFYIYRQAFTQFKLGYGAALSWIVFIIVYLLSYIMLKVFKPEETEA
jgi:multiple sugar transport system permease protein